MAEHDGGVQTAIVLQGGGALGAYEYGVLRALYAQRPGFRPVAVTGVSIGAITAAVVGGARADPIAALDELWRERLTVPAPPGLPAPVDRSLSLLGNPGMYRLRPFPWSGTRRWPSWSTWRGSTARPPGSWSARRTSARRRWRSSTATGPAG